MPSIAKQVQFRLGTPTLDAIDRIMSHHGLSSRAEVVRLAVAAEDRRIAGETPPKKIPRKSRSGD